MRRSYSARFCSRLLSLKRAEPKAPEGVCFESGDGLAAFLAGVDQILGQRADDAVTARVQLADLAGGYFRAVSITPAAEALMTAVTPPDWA